MADITYTVKATERNKSPGNVVGKGDAGVLKVLFVATLEVAASAQNSTIKFGRIPSIARLSGLSRVYWDDLETTNAPTLDIGLGSVDSNITSDPDALSNGHALATATTTGAGVIAEIANHGLPAWDFVSGQSSDPGGQLDVYGSIVDAATDTAGTVTIELLGYLD